jgi:8-oxo-dGTP diphosphatase
MDDRSREYPSRPLVGVGAIIVDESRVVLVRRAKEPAKGKWSIPGGLTRLGETLAHSVIREAAEETGLSVKVGPLVELVERVFHDEDGRIQFHYVIADYKCVAEAGELRAGSDASEVCWAPRDALADFALPKITLDVINKALEMN